MHKQTNKEMNKERNINIHTYIYITYRREQDEIGAVRPERRDNSLRKCTPPLEPSTAKRAYNKMKGTCVGVGSRINPNKGACKFAKLSRPAPPNRVPADPSQFDTLCMSTSV